MNNFVAKLLVVDDEEFNREILAEMLTGAGYEVVLASDGEEAWEILNSGKHQFSTVLLDRMMPRLDGMALLARMKSYSRFVKLPVIFQTAIDQPQDIAEGIKAGAFYYLVKPVDERVLFAIVQSAIGLYKLTGTTVMPEVAEEIDLSHAIKSCEFRFRTLLEARSVAKVLAGFYPEPKRAYFGILELLVNAVEHGNLSITYSEKTRLLQQGKWETEISHRLNLPEYAARQVIVRIEGEQHKIRLEVLDEGDGFNWKDYMEISPERVFDPNGRGIAMSKMTSFDSLEYLEKGNHLVAIVNR